ncbi:MAG: tetratricopeptide repeat protein, partial [Lysobacteraceae bacterium]
MLGPSTRNRPMNEALSIHWNEARRHEAAGDVAAARAAYEALLALQPMQVVPRLRLSRFAQLSDRYIESRSHALEAARIAADGRVGKDAGFISLRLLAFAEYTEVARLVESLDWSDEEVLKQSAVLAQHLWLAGRHEQALRFLDAVGLRVRPNPQLSGTRANVLRSLGRLDEATGYYEHALRLNPDDAYLHRSLAYHQPSAVAGARLPGIRAALARPRAEPVERAQLLYALFKELDDQGDAGGAWEALAEGSAILRHASGHDRAAEARQFESVRSMDVASATPGSRDPEGQVPIFIVGMPRTGTTLLERILGNRPDAVALGERNDFDAAISLASDHFYRGGLHETDWRKLERMDCRDAGAIYLGRVAPADVQCRFFIDKNPQNFFNIGLILRALPHARILCLRRDPMDACFSNLKEVF